MILFLVFRSDNDILRRCSLEFQQQFIDIAEVDPFKFSFLKKKNVQTFFLDKISDIIFFRLLDFVEETFIRHTLNANGKKKNLIYLAAVKPQKQYINFS